MNTPPIPSELQSHEYFTPSLQTESTASINTLRDEYKRKALALATKYKVYHDGRPQTSKIMNILSNHYCKLFVATRLGVNAEHKRVRFDPYFKEKHEYAKAKLIERSSMRFHV